MKQRQPPSPKPPPPSWGSAPSVLLVTLALSLPLLGASECNSEPPDLDGDGYSEATGDCDDTDPQRFPGATEYCDGAADEDCDGAVDETDCWSARYQDHLTTERFDLTGEFAAGVGDQDGDGILDIVVSSRRQAAPECEEFDCDRGAVHILSGAFRGDKDISQAMATIYGDYTDEGEGSFGYVLPSGADMNGDGLVDLVVGPGGTLNVAYVFFGPVQGTHLSSEADVRLTGPLGIGVDANTLAVDGDPNGDGQADLLVGAPYLDTFTYGDNAGSVFLVSGPFTEPAVDVVAHGTARITGVRDNGSLGYAVSMGGDVNGDGYDDVLVGAIGASGAYLFHGPLRGELSIDDADAWMEYRNGNDSLGYSVAIVRDMNGDGYDEIALGDPWAFKNGDYVGLVEIIYGPIEGDMRSSNMRATLIGTSTAFFAGTSLASVGDVDGDGLGELMVGFHTLLPNGNGGPGAMLITEPILGTWALDEAGEMLIPADPLSPCGIPGGGGNVRYVGDVDGDCRDDLLIGGLLSCTFEGQKGAAYLRVGWGGP